MIAITIAFVGLACFMACLIVLRNLSQCSVRAHGKRVLLMSATLGVLSMCLELHEEGTVAFVVAFLFSIAMLWVPEKEPHLAESLGRLAGCGWQIGLFALAILVAAPFVVGGLFFGEGGVAITAFFGGLVSFGWVVHGFQRRSRVLAELRRLQDEVPAAAPQTF